MHALRSPRYLIKLMSSCQFYGSSPISEVTVWLKQVYVIPLHVVKAAPVHRVLVIVPVAGIKDTPTLVTCCWAVAKGMQC